MKSYYQMVKRWDVIITLTLVLFSFLPFAIFSYQQASKTGENLQQVAVISVDNQEVRRVMLTGNKGEEVFDITQHESDTNTIEVIDDRIRIKAATCNDQVCVLTGFISKPGQTIVCLPHKLVIEIQTINGETDTDDLIISS
ncbi:NusG domain II-containing protein [Aquibacillus saliphilus]|uniref:NusG domain II-containing protein n=1 Tax=Aquibacillus saliphilus TaxID=1909422 RepID=UPI001CEFF88F|nr:NusG domain II-containing protein [Aquibacillus saliphilus]